MLLVAGAAAGVAAIFKAPATGAIFALEVPYRDDLARRMLLPALVASAAGYLVFVAINGTARSFPIDGAARVLHPRSRRRRRGGHRRRHRSPRFLLVDPAGQGPSPRPDAARRHGRRRVALAVLFAAGRP